MNLDPRLWRPLLLLLVLVAFALRIYNLDHFGFWQDEGLTSLRAGYPISEILSNRITIQEGITKDTHPPAYYLIAHLGRTMLGESDFGYRFPSVLASVMLVPLLFQLGRRMNGPVVGLLAALIATMNPLQVWYAQEARMYAMLVLLGAAATYVLWRTLTRPNLSSAALVGRMALYFLLAGFAFYTHYTAIFLIAAQGLFWIWFLWRRGLRLLIISAGVAAVLVAVPLVPSTIPRLFTGAETAYSYVSPLIMLQDVVHGFGQGVTAHFERTGIKLLDLAIVVILLVGLFGVQRYEGDKRLSRLFLAAYLLAAVFGLMIGSLLKPMYLGVRHIIIGSPAFILLAARGIAALPRKPVHLAQAAGLAVLLGASLISLLNLYFDPSFAKDDARSLVQHIETRAGGDDLVLYNNAILLPLHEHYQRRSNLQVTALPIYPYLADEGVYDRLKSLVNQFDRIWFVVDPPIDARDDDRLVESWLDENLSHLESASFRGVSMLNQVVAYDTRPAAVTSLPDDMLVLEESGETEPFLVGVRIDNERPSTLPTLWAELYWDVSGERGVERDLRFALRDVDGHIWFDASQPLLMPAKLPGVGGDLVRTSHGLHIPEGIPPGEYELLLRTWAEDESDQANEWRTLTPVDIASSNQWAAVIDWPFSEGNGLVFDAVSLLAAAPAAEEVRPGHALPLSIYWRRGDASEIAPDLTYRLEIVAPDGSVLDVLEERLGPGWLPVDQWDPKAVLLEQSGIFIPADASPGEYRLRWQLLSGGEALPGRPDWRPWSSDTNLLGSFAVIPWPLDRTLPQSGQVLEAMMGSDIQLYAYQLDPESVSPGDILDLTLFWQALSVPERSYHVFVHLVDPESEEIVAQSDKVPVDWLRPTNGWRSGEVLRDEHLLELLEELPAGDYHLYVGLYDPESAQRLPIVFGEERQPDDRLLVQTIRVSP